MLKSTKQALNQQDKSKKIFIPLHGCILLPADTGYVVHNIQQYNPRNIILKKLPKVTFILSKTNLPICLENMEVVKTSVVCHLMWRFHFFQKNVFVLLKSVILNTEISRICAANNTKPHLVDCRSLWKCTSLLTFGVTTCLNELASSMSPITYAF